MTRPLHPVPEGLYDPAAEHDTCGVAFVATLRGTPGRDIVDAGLTALLNLDHRGAVGAEKDTGDGAGILTQIPDAFLRDVVHVELPPAGHYAVGTAFLPTDPAERARTEHGVEALVVAEGLEVLAWRDVPVTADLVGSIARSTMPVFRQLFVADPERRLAGIDLDRRTFRVRKRAEHELGLYFASLSARTIIYKGMLTTVSSSRSSPTCPTRATPPSWRWCTRASRPTRSRRGRWPSRSATSRTTARSTPCAATGTGWPRAQSHAAQRGAGRPRAADADLHARRLGLRGVRRGARAAAPGGRSLPHAMLMMIPEAWENNAEMDPDRRAFYQYHATLMEPWDGPAAWPSPTAR